MYSKKRYSKTERLLATFASSVKAGGGVLSLAEIAFYLNEQNTSTLRKFLTGCVKKGIIRRLTSGIYESAITPPDPTTAIYKIANKLRNGVLNYISLESQLCFTGDISQVIMGRLTVITKGRSGLFETPYGVIEFTHTAKPVDKIFSNLYLDLDIKMYRASSPQAIADLKSCRRNLHMLES